MNGDSRDIYLYRLHQDPDYDLRGLPPDHPARKEREAYRQRWAKLMERHRKEMYKPKTKKQ